MKVFSLYIFIFMLIVLSSFGLFKTALMPEKEILGLWEEVSWEYEKKETANIDKDISDDVKNLIGKDLLIHQLEAWQFYPNGKLKLIKEDKQIMLDWRLKGRGHILQIKHVNFIESYNISQLDDKTLVLNFDSNIQARGIAKLTFTRK